ncbi:DUF4153 domain-containing protein [Shimia sp. MMG029]|uniref:DUF4153 domain-containing protein n=1 Tax=Shimia sp. MMG029 TaxID=3021978 RepID=UPI0022FE2B1C|nr:DUF4153 domain-containing protein [Shimia sp. MMG029]MDA5556290.1 DUF4153 domain-containing protein [Shimia sp. MMG029]
MHTQESYAAAGRAEMAIVGGLAGVSIWALIEKAHEVVSHPLAYLALTGFVSGFFAVLLGLSGPHRIGRAALPALGLSAVAAALLTWCGLRFDTLEAFAAAQHPIVAWALFLMIGTPFVGATLRDHHSLRDYGHLFDVSWGILVRYSAAWLFVALIWAVVFLSDALLQIVGLTLIADLLDVEVAAFVVSGVGLGLGLSVVHELRDYISPFLIMRLLRLLVPVIFGVVLIFVGAAILQAPGEMFGNLSQATTLLGVAVGMITLISVALDRSDLDAVQNVWMRAATAALALLLPVLIGLAAFALWVRVGQYGWTPARLATACMVLVVGTHAVCYAASVLLRGDWMGRIRQANIKIAVGMLILLALWQTPVLQAERISTQSQTARIISGAVAPEDAALWEMQTDWGHAGRAGLVALSADFATDIPAWQEAIAAVQHPEEHPDIARQLNGRARLEPAEKLAQLMTVLPAGEGIDAQAFRNIPLYRLQDWVDICERAQDPGCVLVFGDFVPSQKERMGFVFLPLNTRQVDVFSVREFGEVLSIGAKTTGSDGDQVTVAQLRHILAGDYEVAPSSHRSLWIGAMELVPDL